MSNICMKCVWWSYCEFFHSYRCLLEDKLVQLSYFAGGILSNILLDWTDEDLLPMSLKLLMLVKLVRTPKGGHQQSFIRGHSASRSKHLFLSVADGPGDPGPVLIFRPNWGPKGRRNFSETDLPPFPQGLADPPAPPPLSQGLDPALFFIYNFGQKRFPFRLPSIDKWYPFHIPT